MGNLLLLFLLPAILFSCKPAAEEQENETKITAVDSETQLIHSVFFWLKAGTTEEEKLAFEEGMKKLGEAKTIRKYYIGKADPSDRDVVDDSFDYSWIVHFSGAEDEEKYQSDPLHLKFIEDHNMIWDRVLVYDSKISSE